jgi:hypothetical protein
MDGMRPHSPLHDLERSILVPDTAPGRICLILANIQVLETNLSTYCR